MATMLTRRALGTGMVVAGVVLMSGMGRTAEALEIGERAPDFDLPATTGGAVKLSQFRGKQAVLIEFYGGDFAPV